MLKKSVKIFIPQIIQAHILHTDAEARLVLHLSNHLYVDFLKKKYWFKKILIIPIAGNYTNKSVYIHSLFGKVSLALADLPIYDNVALPNWSIQFIQPAIYNSADIPAVKSLSINEFVFPIPINLSTARSNHIAHKSSFPIKSFVQYNQETP
jgi:hypothetical protein